MSERLLNLIIARSRSGETLSQIAGLTELTEDQVKEKLGQATGLTRREVSIIFHMKQRGIGLEQISQELEVELDVLKQFPEVAVEHHSLVTGHLPRRMKKPKSLNKQRKLRTLPCLPSSTSPNQTQTG
jgi:hypothetical protein